MPRNGLKESTSFFRPTVKVTLSRVRCGTGRLCRNQRQESDHQSESRDEASEGTVPAVTSPPHAPREPHEHTEHGVSRPDPYFWMRSHDSPDLLEYLVSERDWYESATGHLSPLIDALRSEMKSRVPTTDRSVSWRHQNCYYYTVLPAGREYTQLLRDFDLERPDRSSQVLLDANELAGESGYLGLGLERGQS